METMSVLQPFDEYPEGKKIRRAKGDEITVTNEKAERLRADGLARSKPAPRPKADAPAEEKPEASA